MADEIFDTESIEDLYAEDNQEILDPTEALRLGSAALNAEPGVEREGLRVIFNEPPPPIGRGIAWDFDTERAHMGGHGPKVVRGVSELRQRVHKVLLTQAGAHPVHPEGYGMYRTLNEWLGGPDRPSRGELHDAVRRALLFDPNISDVLDFELTYSEVNGVDIGEVSFTVETDRGRENLTFSVASTGEVVAGG